MQGSSYRDRDYAFGQAILSLRNALGLTQVGLADYLGVTRRAVGDWEAGNTYPKTNHFKQLVALAYQQGVWQAGREAEEIRALWQMARQKTLMDEGWLASVLTPATFGVSTAVASKPSPAAPVAEPGVHDNFAAPVGLPFRPTPFFGRHIELAELARILANPACRLLTLVGPGGIGKTRLALEFAEQQSNRYAQGVAFVPLASISATTQMATAICDALNLALAGQSDPVDHLLRYLHTQHRLLILDNFEHLLAGAALVNLLLERAPRVTILVTSRERLNLQAEWLFDVAGLAYPAEYQRHMVVTHTSVELTAYSAIQLFVQRALQVQAGFPVTEDTLMAIAGICQQVAGMPLAIELAASSVRLLSVSEIERQIHANLDVLATTLRDVPTRHRSLRAVFNHSWDLLSEPERSLLCRLAVFRGGCTLAAAVQVAGATLMDLTALISKSLLRQLMPASRLSSQADVSDGATESRFVMLEPIREYALEQLADRGELDALRHAHATYYLRLAEAVPGQWDHPTEDRATAQLDREYDNIRAALQWTRDEGDVPFGLQLGVALWRFWRRGRHISEGRTWLETLLARDSEALDGPALALRLRALYQAAWLATDQHDFQHAAHLFEQARQLGAAVGGPDNSTALLVNTALQGRAAGQYRDATASLEIAIDRLRASALDAHNPHTITSISLMLYMLALLIREQGHLPRAMALFKEGIDFHRLIGDRESVAQGQLGLLDVARDQGNAADIHQNGESILAVFREFGTQWAIGFTLNNLALAAYLDGDLAQAGALSSESVALFRELQADSSLAEVLITRGHVLRAQGHTEAAYEALAEALQLAAAKGPRLIIALALEGLAALIAQGGAVDRALQVFAAAACLRVEMGTPRRPLDQLLQTDVAAMAQATLDAENFSVLWEKGSRLPLDELLHSLILPARSTAEPFALFIKEPPLSTSA